MNLDKLEHSKWDVFISHASEDKQSFVEPLARELEKRGYKVWYDRFTLKLGDSLRESIERGLVFSRYGVVVLSKAFFKKRWPQMELDGLLQKELSDKKVILPVWHGLTAEEVQQRSPILAGRLAISSSEGIYVVSDAIQEVIGESHGVDVNRIASVNPEGSVADLETLAKNLWWEANKSTQKPKVLDKLEQVLNELRTSDLNQTRPVINSSERQSFPMSSPKGPGRFDEFVSMGQSGKTSDVDYLMSTLEEQYDIANFKLVDYALGLVRTKIGTDRIKYYLFSGTKIQRNYAALYFKRAGEKGILIEAMNLGCIDRVQALSK